MTQISTAIFLPQRFVTVRYAHLHYALGEKRKTTATTREKVPNLFQDLTPWQVGFPFRQVLLAHCLLPEFLNETLNRSSLNPKIENQNSKIKNDHAHSIHPN